MWESFFIRAFFVLSWINCTLVPMQCRSPSGIPNASKSKGQMELCLRRCSHSFQANDAEIPGEEVPVDHFCYAKCIGKEGKQDFSAKGGNRLVNPSNTPSVARSKRGASGGEGNRTSVAVQINSTFNREKNQTSLDTTAVPNTELIWPTGSKGYKYPEWLLSCLMNKSRVEKSFTTDAVKMAFEELNNTGRYIGTLSWTPFDIQLTNWTGYAIIYLFVDSDDNQTDGLCQELDKNATNFTITNSSYGLTDGSYVELYITSLPYPVEIPFYFSFTCKVPIRCWNYEDYLTYFTVQPTQPKAAADGDKKFRAITAAILSSICAVVIIGLIIFRYRCRSLPLPSDLEFEYDAFIIFSSEDSQWVVSTLVPTLEKNHGIKCCVHYRDFIPGVTFRQNMVDSVYKCKKTIAVVSTHFFKSKYCGSELDYALHRLMERRDDSLVVIKLDDVEKGKLPKELQKRSYIDYAKSVEKESWEKKLVSCLNSKTFNRYN